MAETSVVSCPSKTITDNHLTKSENIPQSAFYQDFPLNGFIDFTEKTRAASIDILSDENEKRKLAQQKKRIFPKSVDSSVSNVQEELRNERRQEFCPIYKDEPVDEKQIKRKRMTSSLPKRIRWDDLRRKREQQQHQQQYIHYDTVYNPDMNSNPTFSSQYSFEQNFRPLAEQQDWRERILRIQQEHSGFWPESQPTMINENDSHVNVPFHQLPLTTGMYSTNFEQVNPNIPLGHGDWSAYGSMRPPPPPPTDPYPY